MKNQNTETPDFQLSAYPKQALRLLLVEDNAGDALLMSHLLREEEPSLQVHVASDGEQAIQILTDTACGCHLPHAVLLDINLPRKNGFEVLAEMRSHSLLAALPVFVLSGSRASEDMEKCFALSVNAFFTKPSDLTAYERIAQRLLRVELPRVLQTQTSTTEQLCCKPVRENHSGSTPGGEIPE